MTMRVAVVEDQAMIRTSFAALIAAQPDMTVSGTGANGLEGIELAARSDVVVMDIRMPRLDGIEATRRIAKSPGAPAVLILTTFKEEDLVLRALDAGAAGFLLKDSDPHVLLQAIRCLARGEGYLDPAVTSMVLRHLQRPTAVVPSQGFTPREAEILALVREGLSNRDIATRLGIGETTVKTHVKNLLAKTNTSNRVELILATA